MSILRDDKVVIDEEDKEVKTKHGVLIYGCGIQVPFTPKYLSICIANGNGEE